MNTTNLRTTPTGTASYLRVSRVTGQEETIVEDAAKLAAECVRFGIPCTVEALVERWNANAGPRATFTYRTHAQSPWTRQKGALDSF